MTPIWSLLKGAKFPKNNPRLTSFMETNTRWFLVVEKYDWSSVLFQRGNTLSRVKWTIFKLQATSTPTWPLFEQANTYSHCFTIAVSESNNSLQLSIILTCWMVELQNFFEDGKWELPQKHEHNKGVTFDFIFYTVISIDKYLAAAASNTIPEQHWYNWAHVSAGSTWTLSSNDSRVFCSGET